jgi:uncharacterized membrane protein YczE
MARSKLVFDITVTALTALLTLFVVGDALLVIGIGTVICALGTGPMIGLYTKLFPFFDLSEKAEKA